MIERVRELLEDRAVTRSELPSACGIFLGLELPEQLRLGEGNAARRLREELHVAGPAEVIDAGPESVAAALARARRALADGECEVAIAGGASSLTLMTPDGWLEALDPAPSAEDAAAYLIVLSAPDASALAARVKQLGAWLDVHREASLRDVAWTLQCGREAMAHRVAFVATSTEEARQKLRTATPAAVNPLGATFGEEPEDVDYLRALVTAGKLERIAHFWMSGATIPWKALGHAGRRIAGLSAHVAPVPTLTDLQLAYLIGREAPLLGGTGCHLCWHFEHPGWDLPRLEGAWNKLVQRHEMLRTVFPPGGDPQLLQDVPHYALEIYDWREDADPAARVAELHELQVQTTLDVSRWPLFRIAVAVVPGAMHLFVGIELMIADGASVLRLVRELGELYADPAQEVRPPAARFAEHIAALHARKSSPSHREHVDYWTSRLDTIPPAPELPTTGAVIERSHFRRLDHRISREAWEAIQRRAAERGLKKVSVMVAAYAEVLARWAARADFTLNVTVARREPVHPDIDRVVGDFSSNILLAVDCGERVPFAERVRAVKAQLARDLEHVDYGGVEVIGALSKRRRESVLMPVVFTSLLHRDISFEGVGRFRGGITRTPQVTLDSQILDDGDGLYLSWDVIDDYFAEGVLAAMWESYVAFVERLAADDRAWDDEWRDLLPRQQRQRRIEANATATPVPAETLHERVLQQAWSTPDRVAVIASDRTLTYAEVVARAAGLARELRNAGARSNELVAIVLPKGWAQVVAALGVQLSGAAYLPIDAATPSARVAELLRLGEARFAIAEEGAVLPPNVTKVSVAAPPVDDAWEAGPARPDDLAYVIFTSGSTGTPKGVVIRHRAAANTVRDINSRFALVADDRVIALSSLAFDLSVWDIFGTLSAGGAIVIPDSESVRDPAYLARLVEEHGVTIWNSVPSYLQILAEHAPDPQQLSSLRLAMLSGDWIPVSLPGRLPVPIVSLGGATEASIWSIAYPIESVNRQWASIPYGKPLANQRFHVLDERMEDCPDGVPGELYIGGDGLADGYWRDAERTAASFVVHPRTGERLYRTGDWGRFLRDGNIEFLGRRDGQVKISGHRVELGEVEAAITRCTGVRDAAAVTFADEHAQKRLAAFYVGSTTPANVRAQLRTFLPEYMIPARLTAIEAMPLSSNGKVDRKALAARAAAKAEPAMANVPLSLDRFFAAPAILKDPAERKRFVAEGHGVRRDVAASARIPLRASAELTQRAASWRSVRAFTGTAAVEQLEALLGGLRAFETEHGVRRAYPSAGETWGVQTYVHVQPSRVEGLQGGIYYYHPLQHELLWIADAAAVDAALHVPANQKMFAEAAFSIVFVADLDAIRPMYGDMAEPFAWMEAGHMAQLLRQNATEHGLGLCLVGFFEFEPLRQALGLGARHMAVGSMVGGVPRVEANVAPQEPVRTRTDGPFLPVSRRSSEPVPVRNSEEAEQLRGAPSAITETVAAIWRDVLELPSVPLDERFFELGGTSFSILAVQRELLVRLGREVSITDLFRHATVAALAAHLAGGDEAPQDGDDLAAKRRSRRALRSAHTGGAPR